MKQKFTVLFPLSLLMILCSFALAQYQGVVTSVDHFNLGNISKTSSSFSSISESGPTLYTQTINESITKTSLFDNEKNAPTSRSFFLWAEKTGPTFFVGGINQVLLSALTVNAYEDVAKATLTGPKTGVDATRWDLPIKIHLDYSLSTGNTAPGDSPTTATSYANSGSTTTFTSEDATPQCAFSYKTSPDNSTSQEGWSPSFNLTKGTEPDAVLIPSTIETTVNQPYFNSSSFSYFQIALMQSSIRDLAGYSSFQIFPLPIPITNLSSTLGTPTRNEMIGNTTYLAYSLETDPVALPKCTLSCANGFPMTRWEIIQTKPDGSTTSLFSGSSGTSSTNAVTLDATSLRLSDLIRTAGTHYFRIYNRFDNPSVPESNELIYELAITVKFVVRVKANIHVYE